MNRDLTDNILNVVPQTETSQEFEELLTIDEVAALLKVPKSWIYQHVRKSGSDRLPHVKLGKYLRFVEADVRAFIDQKTRQNCA
jgi:excisionase family DNA binding protein